MQLFAEHGGERHLSRSAMGGGALQNRHADHLVEQTDSQVAGRRVLEDLERPTAALLHTGSNSRRRSLSVLHKPLSSMLPKDTL